MGVFNALTARAPITLPPLEQKEGPCNSRTTIRYSLDPAGHQRFGGEPAVRRGGAVDRPGGLFRRPAHRAGGGLPTDACPLPCPTDRPAGGARVVAHDPDPRRTGQSARHTRAVLRAQRGGQQLSLWGSRRASAIALSDGPLFSLTPRELAGVLAHEMAHIAHNDLRVMDLADYVSRLTGLFALAALLLLVFSPHLALQAHLGPSWVRIRRPTALSRHAAETFWQEGPVSSPGAFPVRRSPRWHPGGVWHRPREGNY